MIRKLMAATISIAVLTVVSLPAHAAVVPRIQSVFTDSCRLFVIGRNLPVGDDMRVSLGATDLRVVMATSTLLVTDLPSFTGSGLKLVLQRGVDTVILDQPAAVWGFVLAGPHCSTR
jgi:hypothetical protein